MRVARVCRCVAVRAKAVDNLMRHGFLGGQHLKTLAVFRLFYTVRALYLSLYTVSRIYTLQYSLRCLCVLGPVWV